MHALVDELVASHGAVVYQHGRCLEVPMTAEVERLCSGYRLDDRFPFSWWELRYQRTARFPFTRWLPLGAALGAKVETLVHVVGPWRLRRGKPIGYISGGRWDPVTGTDGRRVTHRKSSRSGHQFNADDRDYPRRSGGTAWDVPFIASKAEVDWLKSIQLPDGRLVSIIVYEQNRGGLTHVDLRAGAPYRKRER